MDTHRLQGEVESKIPRTYLFIDEAKEMAKSPALDRIIADGRKYGLNLVLASQSERHLSADVLGNAATKIVLPVDQVEEGGSEVPVCGTEGSSVAAVDGAVSVWQARGAG
jgi:type IV secretory pathway VirB4 component